MSLDELQSRVEAALGERSGGPVKVRALAQLMGGACQDNYRVEADFTAGEFSGERRLVLRSDARQSLPGSLSRRDEYAVIQAAMAAGVKTPAARWLVPGLVRDGAGAYFMDWVEGEAIGRRVVRNPELAAARESLPRELAGVLARIHSVTPRNVPELALAEAADPALAAMEDLRGRLSGMPEPHPALELALRWLEDHPPAAQEVTLVHGDFRTGNFMVTPAGLSAVLDWEFAHWGAPLEDLAWISVRDWRFGRLDQPVGGFGQRAPFYAAYETASGRAVDRREVHWWEVMGNLRWAAGSVAQGERYLSGEESDLELIAIARRAVEMEFEALRLIERGP